MIILYTKASCKQTTQTEKWLKENDIEYKKILLTSDDRLMKSFGSSGCTQTPVVVTTNTAWQGHQPKLLETLK
jgi:glutaredoxin